MQRPLDFSDDVTIVSDHAGAVPLAAALAAGRARGIPPSVEIAATIALRVLHGPSGARFSTREITISPTGSVRVVSPAGPTDVRAAAAVLWEMLTGWPLPPGKPEPPSLFRRGIPLKLEGVVLRGLASDPAARFSSAEEMARAMETAMTPVPPVAIGAWLAATRRLPAPAPRGKSARVAAFAAAAVLALGVGFAAAWALAPRAARAAGVAHAEIAPRFLDPSVRPSAVVVGEAPPPAPTPIATEAPRLRTVAVESLPAARRGSCDSPFRIDEHGVRRVRRECL